MHLDLTRLVDVEQLEAHLELLVRDIALLAPAHELAELAKVELVVNVLVGRIVVLGGSLHALAKLRGAALLLPKLLLLRRLRLLCE